MARLAVEIDARGAERGAREVNRALDSIRTGSARMLDAVRGIGDRLRNTFDRIRGAVFSLQGAFAAIGIGLTVRSFIDAASVSEQYRIRLERLLGSVSEAARLFDDMATFAAQSTFEFEEIMGAATSLAGVMQGGVDQIKQWMPLISDLAAVTGLGIQDTTGQIIRMYSAGAASADMFRERGILAMLGFQAGVTYSAEETRKKLIEAYEDPFSKFRGASLALATTWEGVTSMLADLWFAFRNKVMDAGLFNYLKALVTVIKDRLAEALSGDDAGYKAFADNFIGAFKSIALGAAGLIDKLTPVFAQIAAAFNDVIGAFNGLPVWAQSTGIVGALLFGAKGAILVGLAAKIADDTKITAEWFAAFISGHIGIVEFLTTGADEARGKLEGLKDAMGGAGNGAIMLDTIVVTPTGGAQAGLLDFLADVDAANAKIAAGGDAGAKALTGAKDAAKAAADELARSNQEAEALAANFSDIQAVMDRLNPAAARLREYENDKALLGQGFMAVAPGLETKADFDQANAQLLAEYNADVVALEQGAGRAGTALDDLMDKLDPLAARMREFEREKALLREGHAAGAPGLATPGEHDAAYAKLINDLDADLLALAEDADTAKAALEDFGYQSVDLIDDVSNGLQRWGDDFNETLTQSVLNTKLEFGDLLRAIEADIVRMALRQSITNPLMQFITAGAQGYFSGGSATVNYEPGYTPPAGAPAQGGTVNYHGGGMAGYEGQARYQRSLAADEYPAVLQRGEGVFTAGQMRALGERSAIANIRTPPPSPRDRLTQVAKADDLGAMRAMRAMRSASDLAALEQGADRAGNALRGLGDATTSLYADLKAASYGGFDQRKGGGGGYRPLPAGIDDAPRDRGAMRADDVPGALRRDRAARMPADDHRQGVVVNIHTPPNTQARSEQRQGGDGGMQIDVMIEQVEQRIGGNIRKGGGISPALENTYGLNRGRGAVA